jgi:uncharacterized protein YbjQ (UPF0145 family)
LVPTKIHSHSHLLKFLNAVTKDFLPRLFNVKLVKMIITTTNHIEGQKVTKYISVVSGEAIIGANIFKDFLAGIRDIVGGRSGAYEKVLKEAKEHAMRELEVRARDLGANAILGVDLDYETIGQHGSMLMVSASGTAVVVG